MAELPKFASLPAVHDTNDTDWLDYYREQCDAWEARCRLAVDALEYLAPFHSAAQVALNEVGPLPAPHTDAVQK